ncbi:hypothetical protein [Nonomuraea turkmeniaca]|uniref:hypothetical protein n=1 Tax=Nonomuraea turkmeniaca TaxID=103838 RepID=UPI001B8613EE|nr:hypothetical protein [Nonomuraea turkmeniaca]
MELHVEACAYLAGLRAAGQTFNTEKTYAGRIALYLSYCRGHGVDWSSPSLAQLMAMMRWLVDEPMPARSRRPAATARYRSEGTANAIMGTVGEFLSWCCLQGWVPPTVVNALTQPKYLRFLPVGFDAGEDGQNRTVMARTITFRVAVPGYEWLSDEEIAVLLGLARHARDAFLIQLLAETGMFSGVAQLAGRISLRLCSSEAVAKHGSDGNTCGATTLSGVLKFRCGARAEWDPWCS